MRKTLIITLSLFGLLQASQADLLVTFPGLGFGSATVLRFSETNSSMVSNFTQGPFVEEMEGGVFGPDGCFYVTANNLGFGAVLRYDGTTGVFSNYFVPFDYSDRGLTIPFALKFGPDGNLYVTSRTTTTPTQGKVLRYNGTTGAFRDAFVPDGRGGLAKPFDLVFGPDGNLYVSDGENGVLRYNGLTGAFLGTFVAEGSGGLNAASGLTFGPDGNLYVSSIGNGAVLRFNGTNGGFIDSFVPSGSGGLAAPRGLAFGPDRNLYVCSAAFTNRSVLRFSGTTGTFIDAVVPSGSSGNRLGPTFLTFTPRPRLGIERIAGGVELSWPLAASNYVLEARTGLTFSNQWSAVTQSFRVFNDELVSTNSTQGEQRFFRLRVP
jgi:streptogramin lyase